MAEPASHTPSSGGARDDLPPRMPRWVKVSAIAVGALVLLFLALQLSGIAGEHGPGRHISGHGVPLESAISDGTAVAAGVR